jgi:chitosanase
MALLTATQKQTALAIVNIFETSQVLGDYGLVTVIPGDSGHLTFGRSQTTLGSGNLHGLLARYCANPGAGLAERLAPYLPRFAARDFSLDQDNRLHNLLRASADDRVMRETQDVFFDQVYWQPALGQAERAGIASPLGVAVAYDSAVHGSWKILRDKTNQVAGTLSAIGERAWLRAYVATRQAWLAHHPRRDLRSTAYRMEAFGRLMDQGYWGLELPLVVRGQEISGATLAALPRGCFEGPQPGSRSLALESPLLRGLDVRRLQLGLSELGADIKADGIFGQTTARCLKAWQGSQGLPVTGAADLALVARLAV